MSGHVDAESLALYAEGQLSRRRAAQVRAHLSGCAECATTAAALTGVSTQLSHVPAAPMPAALAARLDAALSAEADQRAAAPAPAGPAAPRPPRRNPLWSPAALRILAAAGVTLVVAGGVGYAVSQFSGSGPSSGTSGVAQPAAGAPSPHRSAIQGAPNISPGGPPIHSHSFPGVSGPRYVRSGTDYQPGTLATQAKRQLAEYTMSGMSGPGQLTPGSVSDQVRGCVSQAAHGHPVLLVDEARFQQRPAIVIVLGKPDRVVAVSYSCAPLHSVRLP